VGKTTNPTANAVHQGSRSTTFASSNPATDQITAAGRLWVQGMCSSTSGLPGSSGSKLTFSTPAITRLVQPMSSSWAAPI